MIGQPLQLGPLRLATNLLLAPIAGYCDLAFRTICREQGGLGLACTDLLSPQGLLRGTATSLDLARTDPFDKPICMQLYGSDPEIMAQGARWAVEHGATVIDINMGCPVDKVTKKDGGSKLLCDLPRALAIARRVRGELDRCPLTQEQWAERLGSAARHGGGCVPLTCKIRLGWSTDEFEAGMACSPGLARALADEGVCAVTVHGRTTEMKFSGSVRLDGIARVVEAVSGKVPIIGNGDVRQPADAAAMIRATGCRGVMIGRGALSTPWIFRDAWQFQLTGRSPPPPSAEQKIELIRRYVELMRRNRDDRYALFQINRRISWFAKRLIDHDDTGKPIGVKPLKEAIRSAATIQDVHAALDQFAAGGLRGGFFELPDVATT
ncbi:MAG: putative tRNA-dihydrouridine synthase [Phycisphaerales bacterium]|nr:putative tRNA-dihydrouridine synthase [Phycisphaerales bacterium]